MISSTFFSRIFSNVDAIGMARLAPLFLLVLPLLGAGFPCSFPVNMSGAPCGALTQDVAAGGSAERCEQACCANKVRSWPQRTFRNMVQHRMRTPYRPFFAHRPMILPRSAAPHAAATAGGVKVKEGQRSVRPTTINTHSHPHVYRVQGCQVWQWERQAGCWTWPFRPDVPKTGCPVRPTPGPWVGKATVPHPPTPSPPPPPPPWAPSRWTKKGAYDAVMCETTPFWWKPLNKIMLLESVCSGP